MQLKAAATGIENVRSQARFDGSFKSSLRIACGLCLFICCNYVNRATDIVSAREGGCLRGGHRRIWIPHLATLLINWPAQQEAMFMSPTSSSTWNTLLVGYTIQRLDGLRHSTLFNLYTMYICHPTYSISARRASESHAPVNMPYSLYLLATIDDAWELGNSINDCIFLSASIFAGLCPYVSVCICVCVFMCVCLRMFVSVCVCVSSRICVCLLWRLLLLLLEILRLCLLYNILTWWFVGTPLVTATPPSSAAYDIFRISWFIFYMSPIEANNFIDWIAIEQR